MNKIALASTLALALFPLTALSDVPEVVTDIAPVHSLVSQVMKGVGTPALLSEPGTSPHHIQLRPSQARSLDRADLLVWVGPELTPWLDRALEGLRPAHSLPLLDLPITLNRAFGAEDDHGDHEDHGDDDHAHGNDGMDPHAWLNPDNGILWLMAIADELAEIDPENAATYRENAGAAAAVIGLQTRDAEKGLKAVEFPPLVTAHDAYGHFAARFHIPLTGHVNLSDAASPSAGHIAELRDTLATLGRFCLFTEPQLDGTDIAAAFEGLDVVILELDPLGDRQSPGEALYGATLRAMGDALLTCAENVK